MIAILRKAIEMSNENRKEAANAMLIAALTNAGITQAQLKKRKKNANS